MTIFYEIEKAACDLIARGVEPKAVIFSPDQYRAAANATGAEHRFRFERDCETVMGLPIAITRGDYLGPLVVGVPYPLPMFPKGFKLDAPMPKKTSMLSQRIDCLANHVEEWPHNESPVMKALVKRLRVFASDARC